MSHRLADGCQRDIFASGNTRPGMARYIHRERHAEPEPFPKFFEFPVDEMRCAPVLPHGILSRIFDDRKKVGAVIVAIPVQYLLHGFLPFNGQTPSGFLPAVG